MTDSDYIENTTEDINQIKDIDKKLREYNKKMREAAQNLEFEDAMYYRDKIKELEFLSLKN